MTDFTVTGIVTIDNTQSLLSIDEVTTAAKKASDRLMMLRRQSISTLSMVNGMIRQGYTAIKGLVEVAGGVVNPLFDAIFNMIASVVSTALAAAIMLMATFNPYLIGLGVLLMVISLELSIKAQLDAMESKQLVESFIKDMNRNISRASKAGTDVVPFKGF